MVVSQKKDMRDKTMAALTGARTKQAGDREAVTSFAMPSGWWILPSVIGGGVVWFQIILAVLG